jgi:hypothetical protein
MEDLKADERSRRGGRVNGVLRSMQRRVGTGIEVYFVKGFSTLMPRYS